jgi:hypothetical protein
LNEVFRIGFGSGQPPRHTQKDAELGHEALRERGLHGGKLAVELETRRAFRKVPQPGR